MRRTDNLHCGDFEDRIHQLLDDRLILSADAKLTEHATQCHQCAVLMQEYENMELAFASENFDLGLPGATPAMANEFLTQNTSVILAVVAALVISLNIYSSYMTKTNPPTVVVAKTTTPSAIGLFNSKANSAKTIRRETKRSSTPPIDSTLPTAFPLAHSIQGVEVSRIPTWESISPQLELLKPWLDRSKPIFDYSPALFPVCNIGYQWTETMKIIQQSFLKSDKQPGIGKWEQFTNFRTA